MFERYGFAINTVTNVTLAAVAVLTLAPLIAGGVFWLGQLNANVKILQDDVKTLQEDVETLQDDVEENQRAISELRQEMTYLRQEIADLRQEILTALETFASHSHDENGVAIYTRPVGVGK